MSQTKPLTLPNFRDAIHKAITNKITGGNNQQARKREMDSTIRQIVGDRTWSAGTLTAANVATLLYLGMARQAGFNQADQRTNAQQYQRICDAIYSIATTQFGMTEQDFTVANVDMRLVRSLCSAEEVTTTTTNYASLAARYKGNRKDGFQEDEALATSGPQSRHTTKFEVKGRSAKTHATNRAFTVAWNALEQVCHENGISTREITGIIAPGANAALNLDRNTFNENSRQAKTNAASKGLAGVKVTRLVDTLINAYNAHHEARGRGESPG